MCGLNELRVLKQLLSGGAVNKTRLKGRLHWADCAASGLAHNGGIVAAGVFLATPDSSGCSDLLFPCETE